MTGHGEHRINKRLGLPKRLAEGLATEAREQGYGQASYKGNFRKYLDRLGREYLTSPVVHKGNIFIFGGDALITAWPVPQRYRRYEPTGEKE